VKESYSYDSNTVAKSAAKGTSANAYIESSELRLLLDSAGEAIYEIDMLGNCAFCNSACPST
jgi:PAS domain-containing protein